MTASENPTASASESTFEPKNALPAVTTSSRGMSEPQCAAVCPVDCCVPDDDNVETEEELLEKQRFMHPD